MTIDPALDSRADLGYQAPDEGTGDLRRQQMVTLVLLTVGYAGFYLCRANLSVATPLLVKEFAAHGIAAADAKIKIGWIISVAAFAYGAGKFIGGMLGDVGGGRRNFLVGMGGSVLFPALFAFGGVGALPVFILAYGGNKFVQSFGWPGMMKIAGRSFHYSSFGLVAGVLSLSYMFGDMLSRLFMGWLIGLGVGWRGLFLIDSAILATWFVVTTLLLREKPAALGDREFPPSPGSLYKTTDFNVDDSPRLGLAGLLLPLITSPSFLIICGLSLAMTLIRETFNDWSAQYNVDVLHVSPSMASVSSSLFPALGGVSILVCGWLCDRMGQTGRATIIIVGLALSGAAMYSVGTADAAHAVAGVIRVGIVGFLLIGPYSFLAGVVSLDIGGTRGAATACGIVDGVGYVASALAGAAFATELKYYGWETAFHILAVIAWAAAGLGIAYWVTQRKPTVTAGVEAAASS